MPRYIPNAWGVGNDTTCKIQGYMFVSGMQSIPMYTTFLCLYFVCKLKYRMTDEAFKKRFEYKGHAIINLLNISFSSAALGMNTIHTSSNRSFCQYAKSPYSCGFNPNLDCDPMIAKRANLFSLLSNVSLPAFCLACVVFSMSLLLAHAISFNKAFQASHESETNLDEESGGRLKMGGHENGGNGCGISANNSSIDIFASSLISDSTTKVEGEGSSAVNAFPIGALGLAQNKISPNAFMQEMVRHDGNDDDKGKNSIDCHHHDGDSNASSAFGGNLDLQGNNNDDEHVSDSIAGGTLGADSAPKVFEDDDRELSRTSQSHLDRLAYLQQLYKTEMLNQSAWYVIVFILTYFPIVAVNIIFFVGGWPSRALQFAGALLFPLGGVWNILVYTRPECAALRRKNPGISRLRALWLVLKAGGEAKNSNVNHIGCSSSDGNNANKNGDGSSGGSKRHKKSPEADRKKNTRRHERRNMKRPGKEGGGGGGVYGPAASRDGDADSIFKMRRKMSECVSMVQDEAIQAIDLPIQPLVATSVNCFEGRSRSGADQDAKHDASIFQCAHKEENGDVNASGDDVHLFNSEAAIGATTSHIGTLSRSHHHKRKFWRFNAERERY